MNFRLYCSICALFSSLYRYFSASRSLCYLMRFSSLKILACSFFSKASFLFRSPSTFSKGSILKVLSLLRDIYERILFSLAALYMSKLIVMSWFLGACWIDEPKRPLPPKDCFVLTSTSWSDLSWAGASGMRSVVGSGFSYS